MAPEDSVLPENPIVLLAGSDPDLLVLRSSVLAAAGIWSLRVRNADQAFQVLGIVPFDLAVLCYTLDQADQQRLAGILDSQKSAMRVLHINPGDDCSATSFLRRVEQALAEPSCPAPMNLESSPAQPGMIR